MSAIDNKEADQSGDYYHESMKDEQTDERKHTGDNKSDSGDDSYSTTSAADDDDGEEDKDTNDTEDEGEEKQKYEDEEEDDDDDAEEEGEEEEKWERVLKPYIPAPILNLILQGYSIWDTILMGVFLFFCERINDGIEFYDWVRFLWEEDAFLFRKADKAPHFLPKRDLVAAFHRIAAAYAKWEEDKESDELLIFQGEDMMMIKRWGYEIGDVLESEGVIEGMAYIDPEDLEDEYQEAAWERIEREAERLGPEAAVFAWRVPRGLRETDGWRCIHSVNEWEEDVKEDIKQRMREREGDLWRELYGWLGAVAIVCVAVICGNLWAIVNSRGLVGVTHSPLLAS